jgi:hypothetical protein
MGKRYEITQFDMFDQPNMGLTLQKYPENQNQKLILGPEIRKINEIERCNNLTR